ncbi:MAG: ABC transporter ATP-binding protein, partial [Rhizobiales bacterium]|nr:ABC transporter ATP-binding protein [Hyphomicrobiales bacterium]
GEVVGFLGPNGAGKSTTMKMITGFLEPDEGSAAVCGFNVHAEPLNAKRHIGYLPEGAPAYSDMVVGDFLTFVAKLRSVPKAERNSRLAEMAERINLVEVWGQPIENLSKGFKRRVGIAQALIHDPDVLILDEPTDGLDPNQKHEMRALIRSIAEHKAIIVSTHILEEVEAVCSRAVIIADGKILADEAPHDLMAGATDKHAIRLTVAAPDGEDVVAKVGPLAGKSEIELLGQVNGSASLLLKPTGRPPQPAQLASKLQRAKIEVEEIGFHRPSLEDVFRQITRNTSSDQTP